MYDPDDDIRTDPIITEADTIGLYPADQAAAAARASMTDQGSGNWRIDD